jgi:hypothetical protein
MCLLLNLICFVPFGPFVHICVAIGDLVVLCCFLGLLLVDVYSLSLFQRI